MVWTDDLVNYEALSDSAAPVIDRLVEFCVANRCRRVTLGALLYALLDEGVSRTLAQAGHARQTEAAAQALSQAMSNTSRPQLLDALSQLACARVARGEVDYFQRFAWTDAAADALARAQGEDGAPAEYLQLLAATLSALDELPAGAAEESDREIIATLLDMKALLVLVRNAGSADVPFFSPEGNVAGDALSEAGSRTLQVALDIAQQSGVPRVQKLMLVKALLEDSKGFALQALENALGTGRRAQSVVDQLGTLLRPGAGASFHQLPLHRDSFAPDAAQALERAFSRARMHGQCTLSPKWLLIELLDQHDDLLQSVLTGTLKLKVPELLRSAEDLAEGQRRALPLPVDLCACRELVPEDVAALAREKVEQQALRALFDRQKPACLLWGEAGVGKTSTAERIAVRAVTDEIAYLKDKSAVGVDITSIPAEMLPGRCASVLNWMCETSGCVYVVEGFSLLMEHRADELKRALRQGRLCLIGVVTGKERELLLKDLDESERYFAMVEVPEPDSGLTLQMALARSGSLSRELNVQFEDGLFERARKMADDYLISKRNPLKLLNLVREAAMEVSFHHPEGGASVKREDVAGQVARLTGLPLETVLGTGEDKDFEAILGRGVKGQSMAVRKVALRLDMIQKNLVDRKRPPATFLFVGLSGTGKTELAKAIARVYSSTHTLISYAMANFKQSHDVSGLIGAPAGLVGYDEGGKLINDLNRDPYATVLFDEVEKAHPAIWDPFLNLFDEGNITDLRGVTAYGNKAFFIMTSNIGYVKLCRMLQAGEPEERIEEAILEDVYAHTHPCGEKCFRPEFIGRIVRGGGIIVFAPLSQEALEGIALHTASSAMREWNESRDLKLTIETEVVQNIARRAFEQNADDLRGLGRMSEGMAVPYKGGRVVASLFDAEVTGKLATSMRHMMNADGVRVVLEDGKIVLRISGGDETLEQHKSRRALLAERLSPLPGWAGVTEETLQGMSPDDVETMLGALDTMRGIEKKLRKGTS